MNAGPRGTPHDTHMFRAMLRREHAAFTRPVTCAFWRLALAAGIMGAAGSLLDVSPWSAYVGVILSYALVDWAWIRATWKGARDG